MISIHDMIGFISTPTTNNIFNFSNSINCNNRRMLYAECPLQATKTQKMSSAIIEATQLAALKEVFASLGKYQ
jgi:hypothetical protein